MLGFSTTHICDALLSACFRPTPKDGVHCDGSRLARADHAAALAVSPDDRAVVNMARLTALLRQGARSDPAFVATGQIPFRSGRSIPISAA